MTSTDQTIVATAGQIAWKPPGWATSHDVPDGVCYTRTASSVPVEQQDGIDEDPMPIEVVLLGFDHFDMRDGKVTLLFRDFPEIIVGKRVRLSVADAGKLAHALTELVTAAMDTAKKDDL